MDKKSHEASIGFDIKLLKGHIKESYNNSEDTITQLNHVIHHLRKNNLIGTIETPNTYIEGILPMWWLSFGYWPDERAPITMWGFCEDEESFSGTTIALAGSKYHLLGEQRGGSSKSFSHTAAIVGWLMKNIGDHFDLNESSGYKQAEKLVTDGRGMEIFGNNFIVREIIDHIRIAMKPGNGNFQAKYEFIAKVLLKGNNHDQNLILGSPLYVAMKE
jgi:hypothetical protein